MKKVSVFFILTGVLMIFSGCHLKHDMLPATCTEPSTCSVCGKTEGEALGHIEVPDEAVEPTCTEDGRTAGSHCEVCGEVLVPQDPIEAPGHDWEEASFSEPKICRVCGAKEGEALGTDLFINALNKPLQEEDDTDSSEMDVKSVSGDESNPADAAGKENSFHKEIRISGHSMGLGEADDFLNSSSFRIIADTEDEQFKILAEAVIKDSEPFEILLAGDQEGLGLTLPGITEDYYYASYETLAEMMESYGQSYLPANSGPDWNELIGSEEFRNLLMKYEKILFSVVSFHNTKETRMEYTLTELGKKQKCWVLEISPDKGDWRTMLRKLLTTVSEDEDLFNIVLTPLAEQMYYYDEYAAFFYDSPEAYAEDFLEEFRDNISFALEDVDSIAEELAELSFTVAYGNHRIYALSVHDTYDTGLYYESYGDLETQREDVLVMRTDAEKKRIAYNKVRSSSGRVTGRMDLLDDEERILSYVAEKDENDRLSFDIRYSSPEFTFNIKKENDGDSTEVNALFDSKDTEAAVEVGVSETEERLSVPDKKKILKTEEDFSDAFDTISEEIRQAELFGHDWEEASCIKPRTCRICGETEGEPLGHNWKEADCTEPRTCRRCGETEGEALGHDWGESDKAGKRTCRRCGETEEAEDDTKVSPSRLKYVEAEDGYYRNDTIGLSLDFGNDWIFDDQEEMASYLWMDEEDFDWNDLDAMLQEYTVLPLVNARTENYSANVSVQILDTSSWDESEKKEFLDYVVGNEGDDTAKAEEKVETISGKRMRSRLATGYNNEEPAWYAQEFVYYIHDYAVDVNLWTTEEEYASMQELLDSISLSDEVKETAAERIQRELL